MTDEFSYFYLYTDSGATYEFMDQALKSYEAMNIKTRHINRNDIVKKKLLQKNKDKILGIFFPGARSGQAYHDDLGEIGVTEVKNYVTNGGVYQGFCAGAYMGCREIIYRGMHTNKDVISQWDFFNGIAYGQLQLLTVPLQDKPKGWQTANITNVTYYNHTQDLTEQTDVLYWGGPLLIPDKDENITVLARYNNLDDPRSDIAIASKNYGEGLIVLSGVHSEISGAMLIHSPSAKAIDHEKGEEKGKFRHYLANSLLMVDENRSALFHITLNEIFRTKRGRDHLEKFLGTSSNPSF